MTKVFFPEKTKDYCDEKIMNKEQKGVGALYYHCLPS